VGEWYYIGHYGQLGPLTKDQVDELISGGVISRETYIWRNGMPDWLRADMVPEIQSVFATMTPVAPPPPPLSQSPSAPPQYATDLMSGNQPVRQQPQYHPSFVALKSDRSRSAAGILQILIPGVGRIYMGYSAIGVLQLVLTPCLVGWAWSIADGIIILSGGVKMDGYGRQMAE
jgi:hypothetical protein